MYVYNDVLITHVLKSVWYFLVYLIKQVGTTFVTTATCMIVYMLASII